MISWRGEQHECSHQHIGVCVCRVLCFMAVLSTVAGSLCVCICVRACLAIHAQSYHWHNVGHGASPPSGYSIQQTQTHTHVALCFDLAWINARCPPKPPYHSASSTGQGRGNVTKGSRVETRTGRNHSLITVMDKTD